MNNLTCFIKRLIQLFHWIISLPEIIQLFSAGNFYLRRMKSPIAKFKDLPPSTVSVYGTLWEHVKFAYESFHHNQLFSLWDATMHFSCYKLMWLSLWKWGSLSKSFHFSPQPLTILNLWSTCLPIYKAVKLWADKKNSATVVVVKNLSSWEPRTTTPIHLTVSSNHFLIQKV